MEPEVYFLKYAFPCSFVLWKIGRQITEEEYRRLEDVAVNNKVLPREFLERVFTTAFGQIEKIAEELGKDKWDVNVIKEYFCVRHNAFLEHFDNPAGLKEICKVYKAVVKEVGDDELIVEYGEGKKRKVKKTFVRDVKVGDKVTIHYDYAVEKI